MKILMTLFLLLVLLISCKPVNSDCNESTFVNAPNQEWFVAFSGSGEEAHGHYILQCSDGGYLQVGETGAIPNSAKILVVKIDGSGNFLWQQEFGSEGHNLGNSAIETAQSYVIAGSMNNNSTLLQLDKSSGILLSQITHDNGGSNAYEHLVASDTGFVAVGYRQAEDANNTFYTEGKGYLVAMDFNGNKLWELSPNQNLSHAYRIFRQNGSLWVSGLTNGAEDYALWQSDLLGNQLKMMTYGGSMPDHCFGMDIGDQGIFLTGHTLSGTENWDTYTVMTDYSGSVLWESIHGNPRGFKPKFIHDEAWGVRATPDGGCIVIAGTGDEYARYKRKCGTEGDVSNAWKVYALKFDPSGNLEWQSTYGDVELGDWAGEDVCLSDDGGCVIAVDNGSFGFLKLSSF